MKNKWCSNLLGTDTRVFSPNESRSHRGIIRDVPVEISTDDIKNVLPGKKEEEIQVIRYIKGGKAIPLVERVFLKNARLTNIFKMELRWSICTSRWTQNVQPNRLFNVSTVNNGVAMYPKFVKTNRGVPSVATSTQQTVIKNINAMKNMNMQKIVSHQLKSTV